MNARHPHLALGALVIALALITGCAGNPTRTATGSNAGDHAAAGVGIGALAGFAACKALGGSGSSCTKAAVATAAVGGFVGWRSGKQRDLEEARLFESTMRANRMAVVTEVTQVERADDAGRAEAVSAWKGTTVGLPLTLLSQRNPEVQRSVELAGKLAASRSEPSRILVSVPEGDRVAVEAWLLRGLNQASNGSVRPEVRMLKPAEGAVPFVRVEPANRAQFGQAAGAAGQG